jgi:hypothetical protein
MLLINFFRLPCLYSKRRTFATSFAAQFWVPLGLAFLLLIVNDFARAAGTSSAEQASPARPRELANSAATTQLDKLTLPSPIAPPTFTEAALTLTVLGPKGNSTILSNQRYDLSQIDALPIVCAQIQHWALKDFERLQNFGYIFGTGIGEKTIQMQLSNGILLSNVEVLYMKLLAGLSWQQGLIPETASLGVSVLLVEELWQQNALASEARWSRWTPSLAMLAQGKWQLNQRWYSLLEVHNQWPLRDNEFETNTQRIHLGLGYQL